MQEVLNLNEPSSRKKISAPSAPEKGLTSVVNVCLCMGFVSDQLYNGKMFQTLTVLEAFSWERLPIYVDKSIKGEQVYEELEEIKAAHGLQNRINVDNRPDFISLALDA